MSASAAIQKDFSIPFLFKKNIIKTICYIIASSSSSSSWVDTDAISIHTQEEHRKDPSSWVFDVDKSLRIIQRVLHTLYAVVCVLYLYFNSRYARRRLTFCGHFDYTLRCWLNLSCREDRKGHPNGPKEYKKNRSALFLSFNLYIYILHILYYIVGGRVTRQNNRRRHHHHHHHLFVYYSQRESLRLKCWCPVSVYDTNTWTRGIVEEEEEEEKGFFLNFFYFWSFLTLWSIRRRTEERVDTQLSVIFGHFDNNFFFFSYISIFTAHSLDGRAVLVKIKTTFFLFGKEREEKRREKQVQQ